MSFYHNDISYSKNKMEAIENALVVKIRKILSSSTSSRPNFFDVGTWLLLAGVYFMAAKFGLTFASLNPSASAVWPPTGIALAAVLILGPRVWPGIFLGAFFANITTAGTIITSLFIAAGNTTEAVLGGYFVRKFGQGLRVFERIETTLVFVVLAGIVSPLVSATVGASTLVLSGLAPTSQYISVWLTWWLGDIAGTLIVAPFILFWILFPLFKPRALELLEFIFIFTLGFLTTQVAFGGFLPFIPYNTHLVFLTLPPLVWAVLRFRRRGAATGLIILAIISIYGTLKGFGPFFIPENPNGSLLLLQIYLTVTSATMLLLATLLTERMNATLVLEAKEKYFRSLIEKSSEAIVTFGHNGAIRYASPSIEHILGYSPHELVSLNGLDLLHPDDTKSLAQAFIKFEEEAGKVITTETRVRRKDGSWVWIDGIVTNLLEEPGVNAIVVNFRDAHERKELERKKNRFVSAASYHLRSPVNKIGEYTASLIARKNKFTFLEQKYLGEIERAVVDMAKIINDLLKISRMELGTLKVQPRPTEIKRELEMVLRGVMPKLTMKEITLEKNYTFQRKTIMVDPVLLTSLLSTLMLQAIEHTPIKGKLGLYLEEDEGRPTIRIVCFHVSPPLFYQTTTSSLSFWNEGKTEEQGSDLFITKSLAHYMGIDMRHKISNTEETFTLFLSSPKTHFENTPLPIRTDVPDIIT